LLTLFVAPFLVCFVVWAGRTTVRSNPRLLVGSVAAGLIGLSGYAYIPLAAGRSPALAYNHPVTLESTWWLVSGAQFRGQFDFLSQQGLLDLRESLPALAAVLISRGTAILPLLGIVGLMILVHRQRAFGLACLAILGMNLYIWASYLRLEHYLLVAWLLLAIGAGVALEALARSGAAVGQRLGPRVRGRAGVLNLGRLGVALPLIAAIALGVVNWRGSDRSADRSAETFVDVLFEALPQDAAILSVWDASTPLWHAKFVLGLRPDVLVVDDTNVIYEGWWSRERRIAALLCERPVFVIRLNGADLDPTRAAYRLVPFVNVRIGRGGPTAVVSQEVFRVEPRAAIERDPYSICVPRSTGSRSEPR
nr:hypothetical protein [Chloroflexota bacterium]